MTERPRPDMDKVRDAMREHDEREDAEPVEPTSDEDDAGDDDDEAET
jgi:hypothetical protein